MKKACLVLSFLCTVPVFAEPIKIELSSLRVERGISIEGTKRNQVTISPVGSAMLQFLLISPDKPIIGIDKSASKLTKFTSDKATSFNTPELAQVQKLFLYPGAVNLGNGHLCHVTASAALPLKDAAKVVFEATLAVRRGITRKTVEQKNVTIKNGTKIIGGPVPMEIRDVYNLYNPAKGPTTFAIKFLRETDRDIKFEIFDASGNKVIQTGLSSHGWGGEALFTLPHSVSRVTLRFSYWDKVESLTVPVHIETGLDLQNSSNAQSKSH